MPGTSAIDHPCDRHPSIGRSSARYARRYSSHHIGGSTRPNRRPKQQHPAHEDPVSQANRQNRKIHPTTPPKPEASKSQPMGLTFSHSQDPKRKFGRWGFSRSGASHTGVSRIRKMRLGVASTHLFDSCIYGFGIARQLYNTFGWKAHGDSGPDANFTLQVQVTAMQFDKRLG